VSLVLYIHELYRVTQTPKAVEPDAPLFDYASFNHEQQLGAIAFDGSKIALIHAKPSHQPYGGVRGRGGHSGRFTCEIIEEVGCEIEVTIMVGSIFIIGGRRRNRLLLYSNSSRDRH